MNNSQAIVKLFTAGVFVSTVILSPFVLDFTLAARFISITFFIALAACFLYASNFRIKLTCDPVLLSYLFYTLFCGASIFWAGNKAEACFAASKIALSFLIFLTSYFCLKAQPAFFLERLRKISVLVFYILFISVLFEYRMVKTWDKDWMYTLTGLNGHKNLYASFLFLNLFFLISASGTTTGAWRFFSMLGVVLSVCMLLFLRTKAVWLGLFTALFIYGIYRLYKPGSLFVRPKWYIRLLFWLLVVNVFFLFALHPLILKGIQYSIVQRETNIIDAERLALWNKTYHMIKNNTVFGVGSGNWQVYFPDATLRGLWRAEDLNYTFQRPHNDFLWILSETGIVGFNLFMVFLILLLSRVAGALKFIAGAHVTEAAVCLAFLAGYYVISFFDFPMERVEHLIWINLLLGMGYYYIRSYFPPKGVFTMWVTRPIIALCGLGLSVILFLGVLRYRSETLVRELYDAKRAGDAARVIAAGQSACNFFYTLDPTSLPIYWYTGNANATRGNYDLAHRDFLKAYSFNPYNRNVLNDLASSYSFQNRQDSAEFFYLEACRISPRFDEPRLNLAALYIGQGKYKEASGMLDSLFHDSDRRTRYRRMVDLMTKE